MSLIERFLDLFFEDAISSPNKPSENPADDMACYHALQRNDCWYFQKGSCRCDYHEKAKP